MLYIQVDGTGHVRLAGSPTGLRPGMWPSTISAMSAPTALRAAGTRVMLVVLYWLLMAALLGFLVGVSQGA